MAQKVQPNAAKPVSPELQTQPNWNAEGHRLGQVIVGAEQGVIVAGQNLAKTKLDTLKELATINDVVSRNQFIGGVQSAFIETDGNKLKKAHSNFMADMRRVSTGIENNTQQFIVGKLSAEGDYAKIMESIPRASKQGGSNQGTGTKAVIAAAVEASKAEGHDAVKDKLAAPPKAEQVETVDVDTDDVVRKINFAHENQIEAFLVALAKRCEKSSVTLHKSIGSLILRELNADDVKEQKAA